MHRVHIHVYMYILYHEELLTVRCPFGKDDVAQDGQSVYNFLLAANAVMAQNRFVQITVREDVCDFCVSGYVKTQEEFCKYLSDYLSIINDSAVLQRKYFQHLEQDNSEVPNQTTTNNTTVN